MRALFVGLSIVAAIELAHSQSPAAQTPSPSFEVASVKPNKSGTGIRGFSFPAYRFVATNAFLRDLITLAYGEPGQVLPDSQLSGAPSWIDSDRFDIIAKVGSDSLNSAVQKQLMLRRLLEERFKLIVHVDTKDLPIYALMMARRDLRLGPQLRHADVDCEALAAEQPGQRERCVISAPPSGNMVVRGQTMTALANVFTRLLNRVVRDRTGLMGGFDADVRFNPEGLPGMASLPPGVDRPASDVPSLFTALEEQLGLKLESTKGPVDVLVIDSVERPTED